MRKLQIYRMKLGKSSYIIRENNMITEALIKSNKRVTVEAANVATEEEEV